MFNENTDKALASAASSVSPIASFAINYSMARASSSRDNRMMRENMNLQNMQNRQNIRDSALLNKQGLEQAGLSTALMNAGSMNAPTSATPAGPTTSVPSLSLLDMLSAQNMQAQTDKLKEETRGEQIKNNNADEESKSAKKIVNNRLDSLIAEASKKGNDVSFLRGLKNAIGDTANGGTLASLINGMNAERLLSSNIRYDADDAIETFIRNGDFGAHTKELEDMPHVGRRLLAQQLANSVQQLALIKANTKLTNAERQKVNAEFDKVYSEIANLEASRKLTKAQADSIKNLDIRSMIKEGDYSGASLALLVKLLEACIGKIP